MNDYSLLQIKENIFYKYKPTLNGAETNLYTYTPAKLKTNMNIGMNT